MNWLSHLYVASHLDEMRMFAAAERLAPARPESHRFDNLAAAVKSAWSLLSGPAERPMQLPTLTNDPYRG